MRSPEFDLTFNRPVRTVITERTIMTGDVRLTTTFTTTFNPDGSIAERAVTEGGRTTRRAYTPPDSADRTVLNLAGSSVEVDGVHLGGPGVETAVIYRDGGAVQRIELHHEQTDTPIVATYTRHSEHRVETTAIHLQGMLLQEETITTDADGRVVEVITRPSEPGQESVERYRYLDNTEGDWVVAHCEVFVAGHVVSRGMWRRTLEYR